MTVLKEVEEGVCLMNIIKCTIEGGKYTKYQSSIVIIRGKTLRLGYEKYLTFSHANDACHVSRLFVVVTFIRFTLKNFLPFS